MKKALLSTLLLLGIISTGFISTPTTSQGTGIQPLNHGVGYDG